MEFTRSEVDIQYFGDSIAVDFVENTAKHKSFRASLQLLCPSFLAEFHEMTVNLSTRQASLCKDLA